MNPMRQRQSMRQEKRLLWRRLADFVTACQKSISEIQKDAGLSEMNEALKIWKTL